MDESCVLADTGSNLLQLTLLAVICIALAGLLLISLRSRSRHRFLALFLIPVLAVGISFAPKIYSTVHAADCESASAQPDNPSPSAFQALLDDSSLLLQASTYSGSGDIQDGSGNNLNASLIDGSSGPTFFLPYDDEKYIWNAGWGDETVRTSAANLPSGNEVLVWRWDHDQDRSNMIDPLANSLTSIPIGDDNTGLVGELQFQADGHAVWRWSETGTGLPESATSTDAYPTAGRYRGAMRFDPTTGSVSFWTQPLDGDWSAEPGVSGWTQVGSTVTSGSTTLASTTGNIETGQDEDIIDGGTRQYGGKLYRLTVSGSNLSDSVDLYPNRDAQPPYATIVSQDGETWTFRRADPETTSYSINVVDRDLFALGNGSLIRTPASSITDFGTTSFSDVIVYQTYATQAHGLNIIDGSTAFANPLVFGNPGFAFAYVSSLGGFVASASDGTDTLTLPTASTPSAGQWHVLVRVVDRENDQMSVWLDGTKILDNADISTIGDASWGGAVTIGGFSDGPGLAGGALSLDARLSFGRVLTPDEINTLQDGFN